jgi:hypothetical protein
MIGKQGLGAGIAFAWMVASALPACGRSAGDSDRTDDPHAGAGHDGQSDGGGGPDATPGGADGVGQGGDGQDPRGGDSQGGEAQGGDGQSQQGRAGQGGELGGAGPEPCEPGTRTCDGPSVRACDATGISTIERTCSLSQVCRQGECRAIACVPDREFCDDKLIRTCNDDGTDSVAIASCETGTFCLEHDGVAACSATPCVADSLMCVNNVATRCKPDGFGPKPDGVDCSLTAQLCQDGACVDPTCVPGQKLCEHDDVYLCVGGGVDAVLFTKCEADEICDPELVACRSRICEPGKLGCDGSRKAACNALGTGWEQTGTDCAASNQLCVAGACQTQVCVPNSTFCQGIDVYQCDALGITTSIFQACALGYTHCAPYSAIGAYCYYNSCVPGAALCNGTVATKCNAEGSGYEPGGTDCSPDGVCDYYGSNTCKPKICEPGAYSCQSGSISYCQNGLSQYFSQVCPSDAPCAQTNNGPACVPYECWPGLKSCIGNQVGVCAADGMSLGSVKQDCAATDEVCTSESACGASAVDSVGSAEELTSVMTDSVFGDVVDVHSNRKLTQLEANMVLAGSRDLRWLVFELVDGYYVARYDKVVTDQSGSGYLSSGPISYTLKAGKRYLLGVAVKGGGAAPYYDATPWQPEASFGTVLGGLTTNYSTSIWSYYVTSGLVYDFRFTTELP